MDFVAIDFETANEKRSSACSLGITVVKNNKIVEERYWLIKPRPFRFEPMNIIIHGIRDEDVINEKEFNQLWIEIKPYLENNLVIAHNASFDFSVLRSMLDLYNLEYPNLKYACTLVASKLFYDNLENHKLNTVNKYLGYRFNHHNASADAAAAANILINISNELQTDNIDKLAEEVGFKIGSIYPTSYSPCQRTKKKSLLKKHNPNFNNKDEVNNEYEEKTELSLSNINYLKNKVVVITGKLNSMSRGEAFKLISSLGGIPRNSVTKKTDILITNVRNIENLKPYQMTTKLRTAVNYINQGQEIDIINENDLERIMKMN